MTATACDSGAALVKSRLAGAAGESDDAALQGRDHGGGAVVHTQLGEHVQQVGLDRGLADEQGGGGAGPAAGVVVGAAAVGEADLQPKAIAPQVGAVMVLAGLPGWRRTARSKSNPVGYTSRPSIRT